VNNALRILAWVHLMIGGLGLGLFAIFIAGALAAHDPAYEDEVALIGGGLGLLSLAYFLPSFIGGLGLLKGWPWARWIIWLESGALLLAIPVGSLLAGLNIWVLLATREISPDGGIAKFEAAMRRAIRPLILALIAWFTLGVMILVGYLFRDVIDPPRPQILTPMPSGVPAPMKPPPKFEMPTLPERPPVPGQ
jgi:hypothetical protein